MFKWEIQCCDRSHDGPTSARPQPMDEITVFVYAEDEKEALDAAYKLVKRQTYQAVECVEEMDPESYVINTSVEKENGA